MSDTGSLHDDVPSESPKEAMDRLTRAFNAMSPFQQEMWRRKMFPQAQGQSAYQRSAFSSERNSSDTLAIVLNAIGYTELFAAATPHLTVGEGVKALLAQKAEKSAEDAHVNYRLSQTLAEVGLILSGDDVPGFDSIQDPYEHIIKLAQTIRLEVDLYRAQARGELDVRAPAGVAAEHVHRNSDAEESRG